MFTIRVNGILDACACIDWLRDQGYYVLRGINNDGTWLIVFTYIENK